MLKQRNYNEMVTYILDKIREMDISEDDKKTLFAYITSLESKYFMEMGDAQQWIPCSERLPEENSRCLVTVNWRDHVYVDIDDYYCYGWDDYKDAVLAWCELPEPWKGERNDSTNEADR